MPGHEAVHPDAVRWGGWSWEDPAHGEHFRRCSYCGSVHPDDLADEPVWHADWADRKYGYPHKFYVDIPNRHPDTLFAVGSTYGGPPDWPVPAGYVAWADLNGEQHAILERDGAARGEPKPRAVLFGPRPAHFGKLYTVHLSDPDITDEVKDKLQERSGLRIEFRDGNVHWSPWPGEHNGL